MQSPNLIPNSPAQLGTLGLLLLVLIGCKGNTDEYVAPYVPEAPIINGRADEEAWQSAEWAPIDNRWLGPKYDEEDFQGRYKAVYTESRLYLLVEIVDDTLIDIHEDPLQFYWDDDCVEIFVDEDNSGGYHQYDHNAFAYHVALDYNVVDIGPDSLAHFYNDHVVARRICQGKTCTWELAVALYDDTFKDGELNTPVKLEFGKTIGFAIAYCDNDYSEERENFVGSVSIPGRDKNKGWITADVFGKITLQEP